MAELKEWAVDQYLGESAMFEKSMQEIIVRGVSSKSQSTEDEGNDWIPYSTNLL